MKHSYLLAFLLSITILGSFVPATALAQSRDNEERGIFPAIFRLMERAREERNEERQQREERREREERQEEAQEEAPPQEEPASEVPATSTDDAPSPAPDPAPSPLPPSPAEPAEIGWGATTTPILNTHNGVNSSIYADEWPLDRAQSGMLFLLSMGLVAAGLLLAERDTLKRLFTGRQLLTTPALSEKRTALS